MRFLCILIFMTTLLVGCQPNDDKKAQRVRKTLKGVGQGNGLKSFFSTKYKYGLSYNENLDLREDNEGNVRIDNSSITKRFSVKKSKPLARNLAENDRSVSYIEISVIKNLIHQGEQVNNLETLLSYLTLQFPHKEWKKIKFQGANGYRFQSRLQGSLYAQYYIITENKDLIYIHLDTYDFANGLKWVAPIVHTFAYDITPPKILDMKLQNTTVSAGQKGKVLFHAIDNNSGLNMFNYWGSFSSGNVNESRAPIEIFGHEMKSIGNDWYSIEFNINKYLPPGNYTLNDFAIEDNAKNRGSFNRNKFNVVLTVVNDGPIDTTPPVVHEIKLKENVVVAGSKGTIVFKVTDDVSGLNTQFTFIQGGFKLNTNADRLVNIYGFETKSLGNDWYSQQFEVGKYVPSGEYPLYYFWLEDNAKNRINVDCAKLKVTLKVKNNQTVDTTPPEILEIKLPKKIIRTGEKGILKFKAKDDISGLNLKETYTQGSFVYQNDDSAGEREIKIEIYGPAPKFLGNDWYSIEFEVGKFLPPGKYPLRMFWITDNAGNQAHKYTHESNLIITVIR